MAKRVPALLLFLIFLCFVEIALRFSGHISPEGEFSLAGVVAKPYVLPWSRIEKNVAEYRVRNDSRVMYHPQLGWTARPGATSHNELYRYDEHGARRGQDEPQRTGRCTVLLVGDSVTHGDEVRYEESWGAQLETALRSQGYSLDVVNLGMSGYGIDQALLRLDIEGASFSPDLVLFGFQPENVKRNLSLSRVYYTHGADQIPFYKPRYIIEDNALQLIGIPTTAPDQILEKLRNPEKVPFIEYERFYKPSDYLMRWWRHSRLIALFESFITESNRYTFEAREANFYSPTSESGLLALKLVEAMKEVSALEGARFGIIYIPFEYYLQRQLQGETPPYQELLHKLAEVAPLFRSDTFFLKLPPAAQHGYYVAPYGYHLSAQGGGLLSHALIPWIKELLPPQCSNDK